MEFAYNNSYQASIKMSPFDALYGKQCRTPFYWDEVGEHRLEVPDDVERMKEHLSPWKDVVRFGRRGKLSHRYIGPYEIVERVGPVAYRLALLSDLSRLHDVFHVSMPRKYIYDPSHVFEGDPTCEGLMEKS
ncbi:hypothetical protein L3X38_026126 [Prunus dulcis]|uniref:Tf2-1-like SH3-like domain-containing protein n=1 Tax=Prunus dulcis TaxID=3755 RepID=A0AAD4Z726_PRUDU|nr:hypothetical protein L3X38_026126 [Prunus dulcis]